MNELYFENVRQDVMKDYYDSFEYPAKLWHYTSSDGLLGIIQNHTLRFSDAAFVNDGSEIRYGYLLFEKLADKLKEELKESNQYLVDRVKKETRKILNNSGAVIFCMSGEADLLNQWRDYGADIVSYCIGLSVNEIQNSKNFTFDEYLIKVIYDEETQRNLMEEMIRNIYAKALEISDFGSLSDDDEIMYINHAAVEFARLIIHYKNPAFEAEKEWRLVAHYPQLLDQIKPEFRKSYLGVIPYYDWEKSGTNKSLPITDVIVGPSPYGKVSEQALRGFLDQNGYNSIKTKFSQIPIRR